MAQDSAQTQKQQPDIAQDGARTMRKQPGIVQDGAQMMQPDKDEDSVDVLEASNETDEPQLIKQIREGDSHIGTNDTRIEMRSIR